MREVTEAPHAPAPSGEGRRSSQVALGLVTALLGFLLATQLQAREGLKTRLAGEREEDLAQLLSDLGTSTDQIQDEIVELRVRLQAARGSAEQERVLLDNAQADLEALRILLGLIPVRGEGIIASITDPGGAIGPEVLLDAVEELRDAGAEAIEINGVRIVASSAFGGEPGAVTISSKPIQAPYQVVAVGARDTLAEALRIPGGVLDSINAREGATIVIDPRPEVRITSLHPAPRFTYASPT